MRGSRTIYRKKGTHVAAWTRLANAVATSHCAPGAIGTGALSGSRHIAEKSGMSLIIEAKAKNDDAAGFPKTADTAGRLRNPEFQREIMAPHDR